VGVGPSELTRNSTVNVERWAVGSGKSLMIVVVVETAFRSIVLEVVLA
jgi:hypothetical protein